MKRYYKYAGVAIAGILLAGCGQSRGFSPATSADEARAPLSSGSGTETVMYRFKGGTDGEWPVVPAPLYANGVLYDVTTYGGSSSCDVNNSPAGCGTIFSLNADSSGSGYKVLHRFSKTGVDGNTGFAGLSEAGDVLYGTTQWGGGQGDSFAQCLGNQGCGTVFELDPSGKGFKILNKFSGSDGMNVRPGVADVGGTLYGATTGNGAGTSTCAMYANTGCGLVYSLTKGKETTLHTFGGSPDGFGPSFAPIAVKGMLYGTTSFGGINDPDCIGAGSGCGTIYSIDTKKGNAYKVLHRFKGGKDGYSPSWGLTEANGELYGVAVVGGNPGCYQSDGCGTVFAMKTNGSGFRTIYRFTGRSDGSFPNLPALSGNTLYISAEFGGTNSNGCGGNGCGTVIQLSTSGENVKVLYQFAGGNDAWYPNAVTVQNGTVYGTSFWGGGTGCGGNGCGTVFAIKP